MPRYSAKVSGKTVKFRARNQREAISVAFGISNRYSDLKRLHSRWWLLVFPVLFVLGLIGVSAL